MARDYNLNTIVPPPGTPIGELWIGGKQYQVEVSEHWRRDWFEKVGTTLYGADGDEDVTLAIPTGSYVAQVAVTANLGLTVSGTVGAGYTATLTLAQDIRTSASPQFSGLNISGNIVCSGTVDTRDVSVDGAKLDGIESGATADQTAAEILTALLTVDGAGSGLDADLLDGQSGAYYLARANHTGTQGWSTITSTPTTIAGYGITDAYTKTEVDTAVGGKVTKTTGITDAVTAHDVNATFSDTEVEAALDALGSKINEIIDALNA